MLMLGTPFVTRTSQEKQSVARRTPVQERAQRTRLLILETAVQVLEEDGLERFNTNRLAERSGFSVGTIYQYFANKQAILAALSHYERERRIGLIRQAMRRHDVAAPGSSANDADEQLERVRKVVRIILNVFDGRHRARRVMADLALQAGHREVLNRPLAQLAAMLTIGSDTRHSRALSDTDAFVLTRAIAGVLRAALAKDPRLLKQPAFEDALIAMIVGFLRLRL